MGEVRRLPRWNSVVVLRRGTSHVAADCVPTIIISISRNRMSTVYEEAANRLLRYCRDVDIDIGVTVEESEIHRNMWIRNMTERPGLAASIETCISVRDRNTGLGAGTVGGYVSLKRPGEAPKICAMTCHHVAVSTEEPGELGYIFTLFSIPCITHTCIIHFGNSESAIPSCLTSCKIRPTSNGILCKLELARKGIIPINWQHSSRPVVQPAIEDLEETLRSARR